LPVYAALGTKGGVASQAHLATIEGLKILEKGGNAFDAAIAISSILTVMLPNTSSVGGDGFLLALESGSKLTAYNGSGRSPQSLPIKEYLTEKPARGPLTVTVPGLIDLWEWINENYGSMGLSQMLSRAISLAENGFYVQEPLARAVESAQPVLAKYEGWSKIFGWMKSGSWTCFPKLAKTYKAVAKRGADSFYRSRLTEEIVEGLKKHGAPLTYEDFAEHKGEEVTPIRCEYRGHELYELPPNTQGLTTLQLLKAVEVAELNKLPFESPKRVEDFFKLAIGVYEDRDRYVADPNHFKTPVDELLSPAYLRERVCNGSSNRGVLSPNDTTFFVVADKYGNLLGFIQSIFHGFGSGIVVHDIPFQSRGAGFAKRPGLPNSPAPRKRPLHTLSILLARHNDQDDNLIGCAGGDLRPQIHAEVFINAVDYNMPLSKALEAPRYILTSWQKSHLKAIAEEGIWTSGLPSWARKIRYHSPSTGIVQAARRRRDGVLEFVADPRGGGVAASLL
jgi:gamma-glutamyltranspeptidase/glutathione hydrolase